MCAGYNVLPEYYIDFKNYPTKNRKLPIGIFDSGTGGLTVLDAIIKSDNFNVPIS